MLRASSSTTRTLWPCNDFVGLVQPLQHELLRPPASLATTRCRNSAVSSNKRSGDWTSFKTTLFATALSFAFLFDVSGPCR